MNKEPLMFNVKQEEHELYFLVSCHETGDQDSTNEAVKQMFTSFDKLSIEKNEAVTQRASISEVEPSEFPEVQKLFDHNNYEAKDTTKILVKCYIKHISEVTNEESVTPFHGRISFQDGKYFLSHLTDEEIQKYNTTYSNSVEENQEEVQPQE